MKNRPCIIVGALYESAQVHLTQTPVWNAFWVTCRLALMSVILKSGRDRTLVDLSGRFMGCYRRPHPPHLPYYSCILFWRPRTPVLILGDWREINASTHFQVLAFWTVRRAGWEVSRPLGPAGSSLGGDLSRWCLEFSLSLRKNRERGEKSL